jgi:hypothetical protein
VRVLTINPLPVTGGTGSPLNTLALLVLSERLEQSNVRVDIDAANFTDALIRRAACAAAKEETMLFTTRALRDIADGRVTLAFRRWRQRRVRPGATQRTGFGVVGITSVEPIEVEDITEADARNAGFDTLAALLQELALPPGRDGQLYRIGLRHEGADPRAALRLKEPSGRDELQQIAAKLARFGARDSDGPWALKTLRLIDAHPETRAAALAREAGVETLRFKARVRQLKNLGLTESLDVGYRLSPRGRAVLRDLSVHACTARA